MKIIDKIKSREKGQPFFSFEFFPPKTDAGLQNLYGRLDRMAAVEPLFVDITWGAGGSTSEQTLDIARNAQKYFGLDVMMHLTCTNMAVQDLARALDSCQSGGVTNILALRGDPPRGQDRWTRNEHGFSFASDLVSYIRKHYNGYFGVGVGGYPEGHLESVDLNADITHLKAKVDAGADFIITQLFYDLNEYFQFVQRARQEGITCPIIPGILPITNYERFCKFTEVAGVKVPQQVRNALSKIDHDDAAVKNYGVQLATSMCEELIAGGAPGLHFYTLNLETAVLEVLANLNLINSPQNQRPLPWRPSTMPGRRTEDVRPIFWSNRPKSYTARTHSWDDFPNGRWGDSRSPSFGDLNEYYMIRQGLGARAEKEAVSQIYGEPQCEADVFEVFAGFCAGKVPQLPWSEGGGTRSETNRISQELVALNRAGFLTINSQPQVNGAPSSDPDVGWGQPGGVVYQKAYIEFFVAPERLNRLLNCLRDYPSMTYQAVNQKGATYSNVAAPQVNAVTWGVFPGSEIIQPTVVDTESFRIWKDEAFDLWLSDWGHRYSEHSASRELIQQIHDTYFLVNIVENDFINGSIFRPFATLINQPLGSLNHAHGGFVSEMRN